MAICFYELAISDLIFQYSSLLKKETMFSIVLISFKNMDGCFSQITNFQKLAQSGPTDLNQKSNLKIGSLNLEKLQNCKTLNIVKNLNLIDI